MHRQSPVKLLLGMALAAGVAGAARAHHSFAMFDRQKLVTLDGTVKDFQWTNPHTWVQLLVRDPATGKDAEWSIEGGSVNGLSRAGWKRNSLKQGDKAQVVIHPLRDGSDGGSLVSATVNGVAVGGEVK